MSDCNVCGYAPGYYTGAQHLMLMALGVEWEKGLGGGAHEYGLKNGDTITLQGKCNRCDVQTVLAYTQEQVDRNIGVKVLIPA